MNLDTMYAIGDPWPDAFLRNLVPALWQGGLLILLVLVVCRLFPRLSPGTRRLLWLIVCLKMAVAPFWITPLTLLPSANPPLPVLGTKPYPTTPARRIPPRIDYNVLNTPETASARPLWTRYELSLIHI